MALQVWLPLNGDLKNKGCANVTVTNNGATVDNNGKIGKCYGFDGISNTLDTGYGQGISVGGELSICMWINPTVANTSKMVFRTLGTSPGRLYVGIKNNTWNLSFGSVAWGRTTNAEVIVNKWTHLIVTIKNKTATLYCNGNLVESLSSSLFSLPSNIILGGSSSYFFNGLYNDIRIYDHCLSSSEIKEISRGLVLHYKLDNVIPTIYEYLESDGFAYINTLLPYDSTKFTYKVQCKFSQPTRVSSYDAVFGAYTDESSKCFRIIRLNNNSRMSIYYNNQAGAANRVDLLTPNTNIREVTITQSSTIVTENGVTSTYANKTPNGTDTTSTFYLFCQSPTSCLSRSRIYYFKFYNNDVLIKHFIPAEYNGQYGMWELVNNEFYPNSNSSGTFTVGQKVQDCIIYDSSGYDNHGVVIEGTLTTNVGPRYKNCVLVENTNSYTKITKNGLNLPDGPATLSFWSKPTIIETEDTSKIEVYFGKFKYFTYVNYTYFIHDTVYRYRWTNPWIDDNWHFVTCVYDGQNINIYIDGNIIDCKTIDTSQSFTSNLLINFRGNNLSDFRIYATALSAEDVKQLYEVSAKIDNLGNTHAYEFDELNVGRELLTRKITTPYSSNTTLFTGFTSDGMYFEGASKSCGTDYIEIDPTGKQYMYDYTVSVSAGNQFYIGFERYDADKTSRSNHACIYTFSQKPSSDIVKKRYKGIVNLSTDGVNPCKYIRLRILNGWTGTDSTSTKIATVHNLSLREIPTSNTAKTKLYKNGIFETDLLVEGNTKTQIEKNIDIYANEFIET